MIGNLLAVRKFQKTRSEYKSAQRHAMRARSFHDWSTSNSCGVDNAKFSYRLTILRGASLCSVMCEEQKAAAR